jgi:drug/metabolite transporter (DMT)-like permease
LTEIAPAEPVDSPPRVQTGAEPDASISAKPAQMHRGYLSHVALLVVQMCFASQAVESKWAMLPRVSGGAGMSPLGVAMVRMLGACIFFQLLARFRGLAVPVWRDHAKLIGLSILGIVLNQLLFLKGLQRTSPATAALLAVTIPAATFAISALLGREKPSVRGLLGLLCAALGVLTLTGVRSVDEGARLIAVNCTLYAAYVVFSRSMVKRLGAIVIVTWIFTWGALLFAPLGAKPMLELVQGADRMGYLFIGYVILVPTILAYWLNAWALGRTNASLVTMYVLLQPLFAGVLGYLQLRLPLAENFGTALVLVTLGLLLVAAPKLALARFNRT